MPIQNQVGGRDDATGTNLEVMGGQLHELCKYQPDGLSKIQSIIAKCPNAAMHRDSDGRTALHVLCAHRPPLQSVAFLAANPISCLQETTKGMLPLHYACRNNASKEVVEFLLGQSPDTVRMPNTSGWLALHLACARGASLQVIEALVNAWPDSVRQTTNDGRMAIHFACANHAPLEVVQLLVSHCREALLIQDQNEWAPLHIASAYAESLDVVTYLVLECPDVLQSKGNLGRLPIHVACWEGQQLPIVELLVHACPATLLTRDINNLLPLHCACLGCAGQPVIEFLIEQCPESVLEIGLTVQEVARHVFRESGHTAPPRSLCQWLHRIQPALIYDGPQDETVAVNNQPLPGNSLSSTENVPTPKTSVNDQASVPPPDGSQSHTQTTTVSDNEAPTQNEEPNATGARRTRRANRAQGQQQQQQQQQQHPPKLPPDVVNAGQQLHKACEAPQSLSEIMQILAETPAAIEITTYGNALPIHTAALNHASSEILKFLFRLLPASLQQADSEGNLPIHLACYSGASLDSIKVLVKEYPESIKWKNLQGQTPLDKAEHPFLENPDAQVISFLKNQMTNDAPSLTGNEPLPQGTICPPTATEAAATNPMEPPSSHQGPSASPTDGHVPMLERRSISLQANNEKTKPILQQPPLEIPLGNMRNCFVPGRVLPKPQPVMRSSTTPTGWARNVPTHGDHGNIRPWPPQFHAHGNLSHPSPLHGQPPPLSFDPFRDGPPPRIPASPSASPLRGRNGASGYTAPITPSQKNRAPSPSAAQRRLPSPAIIFGRRTSRSRSRSPSPSPMMKGIAGFFRRKGGANSRNSSPARDINDDLPVADVMFVAGGQVEREFNTNNTNNNNKSNTAPKRIMMLPDAPFSNEISLPSLERNVNALVLTEPNRAPTTGSATSCFSPDELARLRGQDFQTFSNINNPPTSRGDPALNQPQDIVMTMNVNSASIPKSLAKKPTNNNNTTTRVFQRPMVVEAGTLTDRAFRPGAVAVNEPVLRPDSALYRAVNAPRAPSPATTRLHQQGGPTTVVPEPNRPGFSHPPPPLVQPVGGRATTHLPESSRRPGRGVTVDEPEILMAAMATDDFQVAIERSRQMESSHPPTTTGMQDSEIMEIIRMQEMGLLDGHEVTNILSNAPNAPYYTGNTPMVDSMRTSRQDDARDGLGASSNQEEVIDRRRGTIEAANIGSFYRSALVSGDIAPIDLIPAAPEEDEDASILHVNMTEHAFGPPRSPPSSFVVDSQQGNNNDDSNPPMTPPGTAGRVNRWAVMTGSPAGKPVSSFYRDAMRTAEEHTSLQSAGGNNRSGTTDNRTMVSSFYRAAILEAANHQGGNNHDGLLAGIEE